MSSLPAAFPANTGAAPLYGRPHWWLAAMLVALHAGTAWGIEHAWARGFMLAHFGLFLLWQPLWRGERSISARHATLVIVVGVALAASAGWWLLALWLALTFGLLGGRATGTVDRPTRLVLVMAAAYVLALLLAWVVPHLFSAWEPEELLVPAVRYGLVAIPLAIFFVPVRGEASGRSTVAIDLFYAALLFLLVIALVLGSFVLRDVAQGRYAYVLMQMLFGLAVLLGALSFLWNPHAGYAGVQQLLSRYVASIGLPFERWIAQLARLAEGVSGAYGFMEQALDALLRAADIEGVAWSCGTATASLGKTLKHSVCCDIRGQRYVLYVRSAPSPGMALHLKLLAEVLAYFYEAKMREERERDAAYERAIHETGARLTHDVKNLLQALRGLCAAADEAGPEDDATLLAMLRRQLPAVTARVNTTLEKLRSPASPVSPPVSARQWWAALRRRYEGEPVHFFCDGIGADAMLPGQLFDGVAENLIGNALRKSMPPPTIRVTFEAGGGGLLQVSDDGQPVAPDVARHLLQQRVPSTAGLGVGLYHCATHAAQHGYRLVLAFNEPGAVRFVLSRA